MIYSNSLGCMIEKGFTISKVVFYNKGGFKLLRYKEHFTWNDNDCVYYSDEIDGKYYFEIPKNGTKCYVLIPSAHGRLLVRVDK